MTRDEMIVFARERANGAPEPAQHTHIECQCSDLRHRKPEIEQGCYCPECAAIVAVERGLDQRDIETDPGDSFDNDNIRWCERCHARITATITTDAALDELVHWECRGDNGFEASLLKSADRWTEFMLMVRAIADEHLPRVEALIRERMTAESAMGDHSLGRTA